MKKEVLSVTKYLTLFCIMILRLFLVLLEKLDLFAQRTYIIFPQNGNFSGLVLILLYPRKMKMFITFIIKAERKLFPPTWIHSVSIIRSCPCPGNPTRPERTQ